MNGNVKTKSMKVAYLLWLPPLGWFGAHRFYLGQRRAAVRMGGIAVVTSLVVFLSLFMGSVESAFYISYFIMLLGLTAIWWFVDGFSIRNTLKTHNTKSLASSPPSQESGGAFGINKEKSTAKAHLLWLLFGWLGAHRLYAGRYDSGLAMFALSGFSLGMLLAILTPPREDSWGIWVLFVLIFVIPPLFLLLVWWLGDSSLIDDMIGDHNEELPTESRGKQ